MSLRPPAFLTELERPEYRPRLEFSVRSGLFLVLVFGALGSWAIHDGFVPPHAGVYWPVLLKLATNTIAWLALRADRWVLPTTSLNVFVDVVAMTWAIYLTGGALSPLFSIYAIELTVVALLSNLGTTVLISTVALAQYVTMLVLIEQGYLPRTVPPAFALAAPSVSYLVVHSAAAALILGLPTFFTAAILRELRQKKDALEKRTRELVDASRQRAQFMANVTHELRTPIHGIRGLSDLVVAGIYGPIDPRQKKAHDEIRRSADSLLALVDDLLELARSDAGRLSFDPGEVDVGELCDRLVATTRGLVGIRGLRFESVIEPDLPSIETDRAKLTQILLNLLANAVKFTGDEGRVVLRASREGQAIRFVVEDTGIGIGPADLERIFDPFHQVDGSTAREQGGVGLGLALVRRLAELIGATVEVASVEGQGSTFSVQVPMLLAAAPPDETSLVAELV